MKTITIYRRYLYDSDCFRSGTVQTQRGVQVHSTGANNPYLKRYVQPDDGRLGVNPYNNSHNGPGDVCANAYIGKLQNGTVAVYQTLPWNMRCWLSGKGPNGNANKLGYIGFEICEDDQKDNAYFAACMDQAVALTAYLCQMMGTSPYAVVTQTPSGPTYAVMDHAELHDVGLASNHGDIGLWARKHGYDMNDFRAAVERAMDDGVEARYIDCDEGSDDDMEVLYQAKVWADNGYPVKMREGPSQNYKVMTSVPLNTIVDVLEEVNAEWAKIQYGYNAGYMMREFLKSVDGPDTVSISYEVLRRLSEQVSDIKNTVDHWLKG